MWVGLLPLLLLLILLLLLLLLQLLFLLSLVRFIILHNNILRLLVLWFSVLRNYRRLVMAWLGAGLAGAEALIRWSRGIMCLRVLVAMLRFGASFGRVERVYLGHGCQRRAGFLWFGALR